MTESALLHKFVRDQLSLWPMASANYRSLKECRKRKLSAGGLPVILMHNPGRIGSVKAQPQGSAPCPLCSVNRPPEQRNMPFEARKGRKYEITVNPFPIFREHLVIASAEHTPQTIARRVVDMTDLAHHFPAYTFYYNSPGSGASQPGHMHFQACQRGQLPLEIKVDSLLDGPSCSPLEYLCSIKDASLYHCPVLSRGIYVLRSRTSKSLAKMFYRLLDCAGASSEEEPMLNLVMWYKALSKADRPKGSTHGLADFEYRAMVMLRGASYPRCYKEDGILVSPGCAEMSGFMILPSARDFDSMDSPLLEEIYRDVSIPSAEDEMIKKRLTRTQPTLQVGVLAADEISFEIISDGAGPQKVSYREGKIDYNGTLYDELFFEAQTPSTMFASETFILHGVVIGEGFHWERRLTRSYGGSLKFIVEKGKVVAVNVIGVEDYLLSVISSEMKSTASLEFLKAHAVISRSWVLSQIKARGQARNNSCDRPRDLPSIVTSLDSRLNGPAADGSADEIIKWFDHGDHLLFDVCADDHCQRYHGLSLALGRSVRHAIDQTWGQVLCSGENGEICDCRFHKCCGGRTELFSSCWDDMDYPYLRSLPDTPGHSAGGKCFCDTSDKGVLSQVLNDFDLETSDFFHWKAQYSREEISGLFARRSGIDIGTIKQLIPLEKGPSGVIKKLKVEGEKGSVTIGKELLIRRYLSESHLKSARFEASWEGDTLTLEGYGWGHGVGMCQIGAAVMASEGYGYREILEHYYPGSQLEDFYKP